MQISDPRFSKRMSLLAYTQKQVIPSGQKTRGDDLFLGDSFILSIFANEYLYKRLKQIFKV